MNFILTLYMKKTLAECKNDSFLEGFFFLFTDAHHESYISTCLPSHLYTILFVSACGHSLLPNLCKLLYQLCESSTHQEVSGIAPGPGALGPTSSLLSAVLSLLHGVSQEDSQTTYSKASHAQGCASIRKKHWHGTII